jgi:flagellar protein FlgJ
VSDLSIAASAVPPAPRPVQASASPERAMAVAEDFEAIFLGLLLKGLRATVPQSEDPSHMAQMYRDLFDEQLAVDLAKKGGIGLAAIVRTYLEHGPAAAR